jgi:hypothetical protein
MGGSMRAILGGVALAGLALCLASTAEAKPARCFTTDDGYYGCDFRGLDKAGSFRIQSPGYPSYTLEVDQPGFAYGYVRIGNRSIPIAGQFVRNRDDGACWSNPETNTKLCAW